MAKKATAKTTAPKKAAPKKETKKEAPKKWNSPVYVREFGRQAQGSEVSEAIAKKYPKFVELYAS